ncbi:MAG TPA: FAD binding domain-containing protein, partial [Melioribacteraceae bacterium]|nr:FAD binding domain-containing protein [Melioribacteraceae bacterium]
MFAEINYFESRSFSEVFDLLKIPNIKSCIIAGGTDVLIGIRNNSSRFKEINTIIDLKNIQGISEITETETEVKIGSYATFSSIYNNQITNKYFPLLIKAVSQVGNLQVRNRATIGGNIVNCAPCADSVPPLLVYNANVVIRNSESIYKIPLSKFLVSPYKTILKNDEILESIILPIPKQNYKGSFIKLGKRKGVAISRLTLAILIKQQDNILTDI